MGEWEPSGGDGHGWGGVGCACLWLLALLIAFEAGRALVMAMSPLG